MRYISTRSHSICVKSDTALLDGIAPDGGLYIPQHFPDTFKLEKETSFIKVLSQLLALFFDDVPASIREKALNALTMQFPPSPLPIKNFSNGSFLELFHGPTGAFKDVALTVLPHLLQYAAQQQQQKILILTATSGDTGSAALSGFSDIANTQVLVFYPTTGTSQIQEAQMLLHRSENVQAVALKGNFDDAQRGVKLLFSDSALRTKASQYAIRLSSANSINIGRLFPQIAYYLYATQTAKKPLDIVVPTGNFGNALAAYYAKKMGAKIEKLIIASNENCAVSEFIRTGHYNANRNFKITNSPSMDILFSSNVERLLYDLTQGDSQRVQTLLNNLHDKGEFNLNEAEFIALKKDFISGHANDSEMKSAILQVYKSNHYLIDPHTAVGYAVAKKLNKCNSQTLFVATATPWKFPSTVLSALGHHVEADDFKNLLELQKTTNEKGRFIELAHMRFNPKKEILIESISDTVFNYFKQGSKDEI